MTATDLPAMRRALVLAAEASIADEIPVGAVVVDSAGRIIAEGRNTREETHDPTGHAEVEALRRAAASVGSWNLEGHTLVVTLEPCLMCAGAILQARIGRVVFGAWTTRREPRGRCTTCCAIAVCPTGPRSSGDSKRMPLPPCSATSSPASADAAAWAVSPRT